MGVGWAVLYVGFTPISLRADDPNEFFEQKIRPVLVEHCYACHSTTAASNNKLQGKLRLDTREASRAGGESGPAVVPGKPDDSLLISALRHDSFKMPPKGKLPEGVIENFVKWIEMGAPDPRGGGKAVSAHVLDVKAARKSWAFQPPKRPTPPAVDDADWPRGAIDRLVLANLESNGMRPAPTADKRTLLRRASYDLLGLPPTPRQIAAFLADETSEAFDHAVDRLLASPDFGVRWARHWLDNVRYAEDDPTCAANNNGTFSIALYRDWVVDSFNQDLPYDQFVRLQVAGDLMSPEDPEQIDVDGLTATGIWGLAHLVEGNDHEKVIADFVDEQLDVLGRTFLGLTISCARCHDHKFDPITQTEYYALAGIFYSSHIFTFRGKSARVRDRVQLRLLHTKSAQRAFEANEQRLKKLSAEIAAIEKQHRQALELMAVRRDLLVQTMREAPGDDQRAEVEKRVRELRKRESELVEDQKQNGWDPNPEQLDRHARLVPDRDRLQREIDAVPLRMVMREGPIPGTRHKQAGDVPLFVRGDHLALGRSVPRGFPRLLSNEAATRPRISGSGRLELARWLTRPNHPLTARVMANRIWQHLFGAGIVTTPSNFGKLGRPPTHPELLDYLAVRLVSGGWSLKSLIREIVTSRAYQQACIPSPGNLRRDPENRRFGRMNRKRLDAEALKDTLLCHSGLIARTESGRSRKSGRALYDETSRDKPQTMLGLFDGADPDLVVPRREDSTSATQALFMLNNPIALTTAAAVANQAILKSEQGRTRLTSIYLQLFGRPASEQEWQLASEIIQHARATREQLRAAGTVDVDVDSGPWQDLCMALICSNEFLYLD